MTRAARDVPLDRYDILLLDMHSTFMFGEDRFGPAEDFFATWQLLGGTQADAAAVTRAIRDANAYLAHRYALPEFEDDFPGVEEALREVAPGLPEQERLLLTDVFAEHERGTVPADHADALRSLRATHELRLISNIWAPKARWVAELERAGVAELFARMTFSSDGRSLKPSRRLFEQAIDGAGCERGRILMVGDSLRADMLGGRRAGLATAWIAPDSAPLPPDAEAFVDYRLPSLVSLAGGIGAR